MARFDKTLEDVYGALKNELFAEMCGDVLEIGPGTGVNMRHYPRGVTVTGVEPNPHMHKYLRAAAERSGTPLIIHPGSAELLEFPDGSMDYVVSTLVLCSVSDVARVLQEAKRVLRPGGRFLFIEHVAAPQGRCLRHAQNLVTPCWRFFGDGCHPNRDTGHYLAEAGFSSLDLREERLAHIPIIAPHILGTATR